MLASLQAYVKKTKQGTALSPPKLAAPMHGRHVWIDLKGVERQLRECALALDEGNSVWM
jgi:hypothetical protein